MSRDKEARAGGRWSAGFSLLELIVAALCTSLLAGAVLSVLVSGAESGRRRWAALAAQSAADAAVAAVARDAREAGRGLELADAIRINGERIEVVDASPGGGIRMLRPLGAPREVLSAGPPGVYEIEGASGFEPGTTVAAVGCPDRPESAALPAGVVIGRFEGIGTLDVRIAWGGGAAALQAWGEPRALLAVEIREYEWKPVDGALQLRRRDDGRTWQPVVDGLASFAVDWIVGESGAGACALVIEATAHPARARRPEAGRSHDARPATSRRWVRTGRC